MISIAGTVGRMTKRIARTAATAVIAQKAAGHAQAGLRTIAWVHDSAIVATYLLTTLLSGEKHQPVAVEAVGAGNQRSQGGLEGYLSRFRFVFLRDMSHPTFLARRLRPA